MQFAQRINNGQCVDSFVDMLLERTLALMKVAAHFYVDKIMSAITNKKDTKALLNRRSSIVLMKKECRNFVSWLKEDIPVGSQTGLITQKGALETQMSLLSSVSYVGSGNDD